MGEALAPPPGRPREPAGAAGTRPRPLRLPPPGPRPWRPTGSSRRAAGRRRRRRRRGWLHCTPPPPAPPSRGSARGSAAPAPTLPGPGRPSSRSLGRGLPQCRPPRAARDQDSTAAEPASALPTPVLPAGPRGSPGVRPSLTSRPRCSALGTGHAPGAVAVARGQSSAPGGGGGGDARTGLEGEQAGNTALSSRATGRTGGCAGFGDAMGSQRWAPNPILGADHRDSQGSGPSAPQTSSGWLAGGGGVVYAAQRDSNLADPRGGVTKMGPMEVQSRREKGSRKRYSQRGGGSGSTRNGVQGKEGNLKGETKNGVRCWPECWLGRNWDRPWALVTPTLGRWFQRFE